MKSTIEHRAARRDDGFTLIELMVVIVIIGILATIVVPKFMGATDDARQTATKAQISSFKTALDLYKLKAKNYPSTEQGLEALITNEYRNFLEFDQIPMDQWGNPYMYVSPGKSGHDYEIVSYGADGQPGGTGYDADIVSWDLQGTGSGTQQ